MNYFMVSGRIWPAQFKPVEGAFTRQRRTVPAMGAELADQRGHHRIVTQLIVVVQILIAQRNSEHTLADQRADFMLDQIRATMIGKAIDQLDGTICGAQWQTACIARHSAAVECRRHRTRFYACKPVRLCAALCRHRGTPPRMTMSLLQRYILSYSEPRCTHPYEISGLANSAVPKPVRKASALSDRAMS